MENTNKTPKYLGETPVNVKTHPEYSKYTNVDWAMLYIERFSGIDGNQHQRWVLDQVARCLKNTPVKVVEAKWDNGHSEYRYSTGKPSKEYKAWVKTMLGEKDEDGNYEYDYDEGTPP
jgi:hypothetical protein